jgi:hypothetical protein
VLNGVNKIAFALSPGSVDCFPAPRISLIRGIQGWHDKHHCSPSAKELRTLFAWLPQQLFPPREIDHITATPDLLMGWCIGGMQAKDLIEGEGLQNRGKILIKEEVVEGAVDREIPLLMKQIDVSQPLVSVYRFESFHAYTPASLGFALLLQCF